MPGPPPRPNSSLLRGASSEAARLPAAGLPAAGLPAGGLGPVGNAPLGSGPGGNAKEELVKGTFFLGRYRVVEEIGVGGMASVHLARMDGPGGFQKWVAIKRIHQNLVEDDQFVDMFLDEARIAAGINHANVAQVFDLGKDDGTYWIAMEYLHGEPLREVMRRCEERGHLVSPDIAARMCADACEGLHAAHELRGKNGQLLGLVHRDVTPHNLFITYEGTTKVVDFGIAKVADRLSETRAGTLKGKLAYMSPEQVRGQDDVDRTTDVFALGVVLWELTTGHRLFRMDTDLDTLEKVQACVVPPPSTVVSGYPIELESVVMRALAKKKSDRFQTAREFARALNVYLQRRAVLIGPEEVSAFMQALFADRIQAREAHLAWAADVTSTINVQQLQAMRSARAGAIADEISIDSMSGVDIGRPSVPGQGGVGVHALGAPRPLAGEGGQAFRTGALPAVAPPPPAAGRPPAPPAPPPQPSAALARPSVGLAQASLVDDDEDVPTTVATREHHAELQGSSDGRAHAPTAALPGSVPGFGGGAPMRPPLPAAGGRGPAPTAPAVSSLAQRAPTFGVPGAAAPSSAPAPTFGAPPPGFHSTSQPPAFGPPPQSSSSLGGKGGGPLGFAPQGPAPQGFGLQGLAPQGFGPPSFGAPPPSSGQALGAITRPPGPGVRASQVETSLSLPRPDSRALAAAQYAAAQNSDSKSTAVLVAVAVLTAICVIALGLLIYFKSRDAEPAPAGARPTFETVDRATSA